MSCGKVKTDKLASPPPAPECHLSLNFSPIPREVPFGALNFRAAPIDPLKISEFQPPLHSRKPADSGILSLRSQGPHAVTSLANHLGSFRFPASFLDVLAQTSAASSLASCVWQPFREGSGTAVIFFFYPILTKLSTTSPVWAFARSSTSHLFFLGCINL